MNNGKITDLYLLRCLTNTHVGSGDTTYGVVDKIVQRDTISEIPVIHSSGIKGAFRELVAYIQYTKNRRSPNRGHRSLIVTSIFGTEKQQTQMKSTSKRTVKFKQGTHVFYEGHLLVLPVRSNFQPFFRATTQERLKELLEKVELYISNEKKRDLKDKFQPLLDQTVEKDKPVVFMDPPGEGIHLENWRWVAEFRDTDVSSAEVVLGTHLALLHEDDFKSLCRELPVIARNRLENGISENLWYEEVVPRESVFYSFITYPSNANHKLWKELGDNHLVQVGGNATIGYGLCQIINM